MIRAAAVLLMLVSPAGAQSLRCLSFDSSAKPPPGDSYGEALTRQILGALAGEGVVLPRGLAASRAFAIADREDVLMLVEVREMLCALPPIPRDAYDKARRIVMGVGM